MICQNQNFCTVHTTWRLGIYRYYVKWYLFFKLKIIFSPILKNRFVLFYLARKYPQLVLCLHGGRFDHPDRMFNSIPQTWQNVLNGTSDYKELVPEFYSGEGDFLVNYLGINFGHRSRDARPIQDVDLPAWASSPKEFVTKLRYCTISFQICEFCVVFSI